MTNTGYELSRFSKKKKKAAVIAVPEGRKKVRMSFEAAQNFRQTDMSNISVEYITVSRNWMEEYFL